VANFDAAVSSTWPLPTASLDGSEAHGGCADADEAAIVREHPTSPSRGQGREKSQGNAQKIRRDA
jgi:hypothetical protein